MWKCSKGPGEDRTGCRSNKVQEGIRNTVRERMRSQKRGETRRKGEGKGQRQPEARRQAASPKRKGEKGG